MPRPSVQPFSAEPTRAECAEMVGIAATQIGSLDEDVVPTLEITSNTRNGKQVYPLTGDVISIGRAATNNIVIDDPIVSGQPL
jgi:pSer/pThr/pTyr-binding forkhead associated (FHA) protein